ncbi:CDP-diacylglycerol--glycerol-3-phosphate 3-phosphatidyltransferase [Pseudoflavonifractor sp. DSM 107456]|uniref:CDP-diacylglycerol--glycerol-3-phosphate 3-phosphatidyltransferase n=2 Tax=Pseudoflavonifractor TaxID=1017280 RepID=A0ABR9RB42_9FIRM|nr:MULTISPECIES: CDP-diacylglycerol--glycerol-3-phosphate 3-phosphatidyltransferase [Eubacteriales]MBC5729308.1 CDP-diacylglycerol--glycerol-3-phosphate 3-phosphatidyltransferase [Pseudoflavonifractor hominis]MBE5055894.1 CDP-diacylglycerol--glycerol-3-phosphate 3-phosphatidyltransferase [Pseudoflavonifractor gallinarum]MBS5136099.1 CDP-diacylglycerol--glycerol-3-phosphate 3-phosphatidyltransferase [Oscillospiraceae bacterium]MBT9684659.1 CDP-diacylglycerol--glycerol-3-phosphate 3-phosphatidylt
MNVPNLLSLLRLAMVPVFAAVFFLPDPSARSWAAGVYALAFVTDIADGWIARHFHQVTRLGRILDPLADKLMTFTVIVCITAAGIIPLWAVVVFFLKEAAMGVGALSMYHKTEDVIPSNWLGKVSTGVFFVVCAALVLFPGIPSSWATGLITLALVLTILAFVSYLLQYLSLTGRRKS